MFISSYITLIGAAKDKSGKNIRHDQIRDSGPWKASGPWHTFSFLQKTNQMLLLLAFCIAVNAIVTGSKTGQVTGANPFVTVSLASATNTTLTVVSKTSKMKGQYKCNGTNDDVTIQMAINALNATGGTLILSDGTFSISNQLFLCSNLLFKGQGMGKTTIKTVKNAKTFKKAGTIHGFYLKNLVLQDFTGNGNRVGNPGNAYNRGTPPYGKFGTPYFKINRKRLLLRSVR